MQNVTLLQEVASIGVRTFAYLTDFFIMIGLALMLHFSHKNVIDFCYYN